MIVVIVTRQTQPSSFRASRLLPAERAALGQACLTTGRLAAGPLLVHVFSLPQMTLHLQDLRAALADDDCVGVRENGGDGEASRALDVHEERAGSGHKGLELVLAGLTGCVLVGGRDRQFGGCKRTRRAKG